MKTITKLLAFFITLIIFQSCSSEDIEPQIHPVPTKLDYTDTLMQLDSISNDCETDPPKLPTPPIKL